MGLPPARLDKSEALYSSQTSRVKVNGIISENLEIHNVTRQGCPLPPYLYVLPIENLSNSFVLTHTFVAYTLAHTTKHSLYANDLLLYVTNSHVL